MILELPSGGLRLCCFGVDLGGVMGYCDCCSQYWVKSAAKKILTI
jgi:hypothetical protein